MSLHDVTFYSFCYEIDEINIRVHCNEGSVVTVTGIDTLEAINSVPTA